MGEATRDRRTLGWPVDALAATYPNRYCQACGKAVALTRNGTYRRHYTSTGNGKPHTCPASGGNALTPAELSRRTLSHLVCLLTN